MIVLGIDPGTHETAGVLYASGCDRVGRFWIARNDEARDLVALACEVADLVAIEQIGHYGTGMPAGREVFDTCIQIGRLIERIPAGTPHVLIPRPTIKAHLCRSARATDANVRRALLDLERWPRTGGGSEPVIGTVKQPGPLYGLKSHMWSALSVAVVAADQSRAEAQGGTDA